MDKNMKLKLNTSIDRFKDAYEKYIEKCDFNRETLIKLMGKEQYEYLASRKLIVTTGLYDDGQLAGIAEYSFETGEFVTTADFGADEWKEVSVIDTEEKAMLIISTADAMLRFTGLNR